MQSCTAGIIKDSFLTVPLIRVTGDPRNVLLYPTHFTSVIIIGHRDTVNV